MSAPNIQRRDPGIVLLFGFITCGLYLTYWYLVMYEELAQLTGQTPTGNNFWLDFVLVILTCGVFGIWVDYRISQQLNDLQRQSGMAGANDTSNVVVILDIAAYVTGWLTNIVSSAIHQDQLNKVVQVRSSGPTAAPTSSL